MKIIALDIDGVMNCMGCKETIDGFYFVMDSKMILLSQLVNRTGARLLLTSTWRFGWHDLDRGADTREAKHFHALREKFKQYGLEFLDYTPVFNCGMDQRGREIEHWFQNWKGEKIEGFVLLDDMNGCYLRPYSSHLVRTSITKGLTQKHVDMAVKILERPFEVIKSEPKEVNVVLYQWSEDGDIELCEQSEDILPEDTVCDYCDQKMIAGEQAIFLSVIEAGDTYILHPECAKKACHLT